MNDYANCLKEPLTSERSFAMFIFQRILKPQISSLLSKYPCITSCEGIRWMTHVRTSPWGMILKCGNGTIIVHKPADKKDIHLVDMLLSNEDDTVRTEKLRLMCSIATSAGRILQPARQNDTSAISLERSPNHDNRSG